MRSLIEPYLSAALDARLVSELLDAHSEAKRNYYLGNLRPSEVEGGRFCEAAYRLLELISKSTYTPLGSQLNTVQLARELEQIPTASSSDSIRIHIPRALRVVYDIRNKRDAAHLADNIDPNVQDSSLVIATIDWVLAEFVRMHHNVSADEAHKMVCAIVTRIAPVVQEIDDYPKVLRTDLRASDLVLVLLYHKIGSSVSFIQLSEWVKPPMRRNLRRTLTTLEHDRAYIHSSGEHYVITRSGELHVESNRLFEFD